MTLEKWLKDRSPSVPETFLPYLPTSSDAPVTVNSLLGLGMEELVRAVQGTGDPRESAFPLLAADALLTYACEAAAEGPDFAEDCRHMLVALGTRFSR